MLYDYVAKFETELSIYPFSPSLKNMLSELEVGIPFTKTSITTKMSVMAGPLITEEAKVRICKIQNETYKKSLEDQNYQNKINQTIKVGETRFIGYETVFEHEKNIIGNSECNGEQKRNVHFFSFFG